MPQPQPSERQWNHCVNEPLSYRFITSIDELDKAIWDTYFANNCFLNYGFLASLEASGGVDCNEQGQSGWISYHLVILRNEQPVALVPGYLKTHSYGEYVFDWAWAEAYHKRGRVYYPKWIAATPFTPVSETRMGFCASLTQNEVDRISQFIATTLTRVAHERDWSGWHLNFCHDNEREVLDKTELMQRRGVQFVWRNQGYNDYSDFLAALTSRKRKKLKKERLTVTQHALEIKVLEGDDISSADMHCFYRFYQATYLKKSGHTGYLNEAFFQALLSRMRDKLILMAAFADQKMCAASLYFKHQDTLYGRYWGAVEAYDSLHFELCYYQGIEYCINNKLAVFNAGAQGEHKILRGFRPEYTYSYHYICDEVFGPAIADFLKREWQQMEIYHQQCSAVVPYKAQD